MKWIACLALLCALNVGAEETVSVCFNYGCFEQAEVVFSNAQLHEIGQLLGSALDAEQERAMIALAIGRLLGWAGAQSPISADRGGNFADDEMQGRMDCLDHSMTTTRLLRVLDGLGVLRFHRVMESAVRRHYLLFEHYAAQIEALSAIDREEGQGRHVVDSWFFDNGQPAVVMPLERWKAGEGPRVE